MALAAQAEFEKASTLYEDIPYNDAYLSYRLYLPKDWQKSDSKGNVGYSLNNIVFGELVRFYSPPQGDLRAYVTLQAMEMKYDLTAEQWLIQYMLSQGLALQGFQAIDARRAEALYVVNQADVSYIVRSAILLNGRRAMMVSVFLPAEFWDAQKTTQAQIVRSFTLSRRSDDLVEDMLDYKFLDIATFRYPKSWELRAKPIRTVDRMAADILNVSNISDGRKAPRTLNGKIGVSLVSAYAIENLDSEIARFKKELSDTGLYLEDVLEEKPDMPFGAGLDFAKTTVYQASDTRDALLDYEFWLTVISANDYYYFVTLLTPDRDEDYVTWSRNVQTYKLVIAQMRAEGGGKE